jgi:hypothetical protein
MGMQGLQGETGAQGPAGGQGAQGQVGLQGIQGEHGDIGSKGFAGINGDKGDQGPAGIPGKDGEAGPRGIDGARGLDGINGEKGIPGDPGPVGVTGAQGAQGVPGINGRYVLNSYASLTGIGNLAPIGSPTLLFSQPLIGNLLSANGDEIELFLNTEYFDNDLVNLIFSIDVLNQYTYAYQNSDNDIRTLKILITRIDSTHQLWSIEDVCKNLISSNIAIKTLATFSTAFDLTTPMTFEIFADNLALGADQVVLKKCSMYLNKLV